MSYGTFEGQSCITCFIQFQVPVGFTAARRTDGKTFYCPQGHSMAYDRTESEEDKLRRERDRLKQNAAYLEDRNRELAEQRDAAERRASAAKGRITKLKNRAAKGICPCCNHSFADLARHMHSEHPDFVEQPDEAIDAAPEPEAAQPEPEPLQQTEPEPAPTTEQKDGGEPMLGAEPAAVTLPITEPEQMPVIERSSHDVATEKSRVERNRLVTLREKESGLYLNLDGTGTTADVSHAYRGTERQAATMRQRSERAKGMSIYTFTQRTR